MASLCRFNIPCRRLVIKNLFIRFQAKLPKKRIFVRLFCQEPDIPEMKWMPTKYGAERKRAAKNSHDFEFAVVSYNVLSQQLLEDHQYLYSRADPICLRWKFRGSKILRMIQSSRADVICLQEVQVDHYDQFFLPKLAKLGYSGMYKKRTGDKPDGCAIFYNNSIFELINSWPVEYYHQGVEVLNRDNIGLIALLSPVKSDNRSNVVVSTTHLLYNPKRHDIKLAQLQVLFSELDRVAYQGEKSGKSHYCPIVLTGDFNFTPESSIFDFVTRGHFRYKGLGSKLTSPAHHGKVLGNELIPAKLGITDACQHSSVANSRTETSEDLPFATGELSHRLKLRSVYYFDPAHDPNFRHVTTFQNGWVVVDHMFYTNPQLRLIERLKLPTGREVESSGGLPSLFSPSDHLPIGARFLWPLNKFGS